jgi:hypothetical protein
MTQNHIVVDAYQLQPLETLQPPFPTVLPVRIPQYREVTILSEATRHFSRADPPINPILHTSRYREWFEQAL